MEINNKLKINEYVSIAQLKRKLKAYLAEQGNSDFKPSIFAQGLVVSLVMVLEELVADCLKFVSKEKSGLYTINQLILSIVFSGSDKYDFVSKYMKKYSSTLKYHESIFFNFNKVLTNLEDKHGSKLMFEPEAKNIIGYIILSLQYDIVELSVNMVKYAGRKTLNTNVLDIVCSYILSLDISNKIKLKLDSINIPLNTDTDADDEVDDVDDVDDEVDDIEETEDLEAIKNNMKQNNIEKKEEEHKDLDKEVKKDLKEKKVKNKIEEQVENKIIKKTDADEKAEQIDKSVKKIKSKK